MTSQLFQVIELAFVYIYVLALLLLCLQSVSRLYYALLAWFVPRRPERSGDEGFTPVVTIQLPIYNEKYVAARVIQACAKMDYPRDRLEIQVLDDSDDETIHIIDIAANEVRSQGIDITVVRRDARSGYKAGALAAGTASAKGEFIAIFDADFVPEPDFLRKTLPDLSDAGVALVQARWEHINRDASWLTRFQCVLLDAHFAVEQNVRSCFGYFWNFNGTAGVWRKSAIEDAGGWQGDTLTEDMDLSYRAQLKGWKFVYLQDYAVPAELPDDIGGYLSQQRRWSKGGGQTARKLTGEFWRKPMPLRVKFEGLLHLYNNHSYLLKFFLIPLLPIYVMARDDMGLDAFSYLDVILFTFSVAALLFFYGYAILKLSRPVHFYLLQIPMAIIVETGISLQKSLALIEGMQEFNSHFERTAKFAGQTGTDAGSYLQRVEWPGSSELLMSLWLLIGWMLLSYQDVHSLAASFFMLFSAACMLLIGVSCLWREAGLRRQRRRQSGEPASLLPLQQ